MASMTAGPFPDAFDTICEISRCGGTIARADPPKLRIRPRVLLDENPELRGSVDAHRGVITTWLREAERHTEEELGPRLAKGCELLFDMEQCDQQETVDYHRTLASYRMLLAIFHLVCMRTAAAA